MFNDTITNAKICLYIARVTWNNNMVKKELMNRNHGQQIFCLQRHKISLFPLWFLLSHLFFPLLKPSKFPSFLYTMRKALVFIFLFHLLLLVVVDAYGLFSLSFFCHFIGKDCLKFLTFLWGCFVCFRWTFIRLHCSHWGNVSIFNAKSYALFLKFETLLCLWNGKLKLGFFPNGVLTV